MEGFCHGEAVWDTELTWHGDWPQFTQCFQHTVLAWVTCAVLWITSPFYVFYLSSLPLNSFPFTVLFVAKLFTCGAVLVLRLVQILNTVGSVSTIDAEITDYVVHIATYILLTVLLTIEKRKGVVASPVNFSFWLISLLTNIIPFYSKIILQEYHDDLFSFSLFYVLYAFIVIGFILSCVAEKIPPGSCNTNGNLEVRASVLSRIVFWWSNRMLIDGYKGLTEETLLTLNPRDTTSTTVPVFQANLELEKRQCRRLRQSSSRLDSSFYYTNNPVSLTKRKNVQSPTDERTPLLQAAHNGHLNDHSYVHQQHSINDEDNDNNDGCGEKEPRKKMSIFRVMMKTFGKQMLQLQALFVLQSVAVLVSPLLLRAMIEFTNSSSEATWKGYMYAGGMFVTNCIQSLCQHVGMFYTTCVGFRMSSTVTSAIYRKALTMNSKARRESTVGEIVNLMSVDARNIEMLTTFSFWIWMSPLWIIVALYLLYTTVGVSMFAGLAFMAGLFIFNTVLMNKLRIYQKIMMQIRDKRVKVISEVLSGIKILKLYAWEPSFEEKVTGIRNEELSVLLKSLFIDSFLTFAWTAALYWMTLFTFMTYVYVDESHNLDASTSFVALSYFNTIRVGVNVLPVVIREGIKCFVSVGRINKYLNTPDLKTSHIARDDHHHEDAIVISNGTFSWDKTSTPTLTDVRLRVKRGSVVAVVGQVGVGKSSLLSAMLGDMETVDGNIHVNGSVAYVPQQAWIQNDSLRNNVLFGREYDAHTYDKVLDACALKPDLEILAAGDMTEIGEKGINLSGGQKQRVSVARAVYSDADVILLDDPLSAVDSHVGKQIFNEVIGDTGLLRGKTRILVTHGLQWLPKVDSIVVLSDGRISEMGSYDQLMSHDGAFAQFLTTYLAQTHDSDSEDDDEEAQNIKRDILQRLVSVHSSEGEAETQETAKGRILKRLQSREGDSENKGARRRKRSQRDSESGAVSSGRRDHDRGTKHQQDKQVHDDKSRLMTEEETESGRVDMGVYKELAKALGYRYSVLMLVLFTIYNAGALGGNIWLSAWTDDSELSNLTGLPSNSSERRSLNDFYLGIYAAFGIAQTVFVVTYSVIMAFRHIHASRVMHRQMLHRLMRAPMAFFDTTPVGRIVNRFSQDMDMLDSEICLNVEIWVDNLEILIATVVAISYTTPIFLAVFAPASLIYFFLTRFYIGTSCQIRRLQSKKRSPIYSHFGESLTGSHVIRAYGAQHRFIGQSESHVDALLRCTYNSNVASRWLGVRLDFVGSILVLAAAILTVLSRDTLSAGIVGLSLSYALEVTGALNLAVRMATEMETNIVSVERIAHYTRVETEANWTAIPRPKPEWPQHGRVRFQGYSTRYRPGLDLVLRDLTYEINPGEKVGIVGRTGAGKSSLTLALFRLIEAAGGAIIIDDVDVSSLGLHDLRNKLNILPQDPVIFDGTIRMNLDPLDTHTDQQVWTALQQAHMKDYVQGLPDNLSHVCGEGGENLSVGQRQLLCLARALLRKTKILILDEATAAVDMETDDLIQNTIRHAFSDCTILTIAHRINTVMDYDRILVMDSGRMVEFDSPTSLLQNVDSSFYKMAKDAGLV